MSALISAEKFEVFKKSKTISVWKIKKKYSIIRSKIALNLILMHNWGANEDMSCTIKFAPQRNVPVFIIIPNWTVFNNKIFYDKIQ